MGRFPLDFRCIDKAGHFAENLPIFLNRLELDEE